MAPRSENIQSHYDSPGFKESASILDNDPVINGELIYVPVATVIENPNNMAINLDHNYLENRHGLPNTTRPRDENFDEFESYEDLIIPYQNRLLTIHQDQRRIDFTQTMELTTITHQQRALSTQVHFGELSETVHLDSSLDSLQQTNHSKDVYLFRLSAGNDNLKSLLNKASYGNAIDDDADDNDMTNMVLLSDFILDNLPNYEIFRCLAEYSDCAHHLLQTGDSLQMCDEFGHPELVGCDSFICASRQIFDMNFEQATPTSPANPMSIQEFFQCLHIDCMSDSLRRNHFYVSFLFYPVNVSDVVVSVDPELHSTNIQPVLTSLMLIEELKNFRYNVIPKFSNALYLSRAQKYRIFCILTEICETGHRQSNELILHQGLLTIDDTPYIKFL